MNTSPRLTRFVGLVVIASAFALTTGARPRSAAACGGYGDVVDEDQQAARDAARRALSKLAAQASLGRAVVDGDTATIPAQLRVSKTRWVSRVLTLKRTDGTWHLAGIARA